MRQHILTMETEGDLFHSEAIGWSIQPPRVAPRGYAYGSPLVAMLDGWRVMCPPVKLDDTLHEWWFEKIGAVHSDDLPGEQKAHG